MVKSVPQWQAIFNNHQKDASKQGVITGSSADLSASGGICGQIGKDSPRRHGEDSFRCFRV